MPNPPDCPVVYPWYRQTGPQLACQPPPSGQGQLEGSRGCDVGCWSCAQWDNNTFRTMATGVTATGKRWFRPDDVNESRDARGRYVFPLSGVAVRLPSLGSSFQIAMCFQQTGSVNWREFWLLNTCDCRAAEGGSPWYACGIGSFCNALAFLRWTTCQWFTGGYPPQMACTGRYLGATPQPFLMLPGVLGNAGLFRTSLMPSLAGRVSGRGCSPSFNSLCWGKPHLTEMCIPDGGWPPSWNEGRPFNDGTPGVAAWNFLYVDGLSARFHDHADNPAADHAAVDAKNQVLAWLEDHLSDMPPRMNGSAQNLDQLDRDTSPIVGRTQFARGWNDKANPGWIPLELLPLPGEQPDGSSPLRWVNCVLKY